MVPSTRWIREGLIRRSLQSKCARPWAMPKVLAVVAIAFVSFHLVSWIQGNDSEPKLASVSSGQRKRQDLMQLPTIGALKRHHPLNEVLKGFVQESRETAVNILGAKDDRIIVIVGPCSIHDPSAAMEYAQLLRQVASELQDSLFVIMRTYLEKPRTSVGWKGLVSDPDLSGAEDMARGISVGRKFLLDVNSADLPAAVEFLDPLVAPYFEDLVTYGSIGARTVESPTHRALAAALSMPIGFKNGRSGDVQSAVNAAIAATAPQRRLAFDDRGRMRLSLAAGNPDVHVVLRGGDDGPNYDNASVADASRRLQKAGFSGPRVVVDCSHGNSGKKHEGQLVACRFVAEQIAAGSLAVGGVMIESFLEAGNQPLDPGSTKLSELRYGCSVTDACLDFNSTKGLLRELAAAIGVRRASGREL